MVIQSVHIFSSSFARSLGDLTSLGPFLWFEWASERCGCVMWASGRCRSIRSSGAFLGNEGWYPSNSSILSTVSQSLVSKLCIRLEKKRKGGYRMKSLIYMNQNKWEEAGFWITLVMSYSILYYTYLICYSREHTRRLAQSSKHTLDKYVFFFNYECRLGIRFVCSLNTHAIVQRV